MGFGEQFLTDPALFPARIAGVAAGEWTLVLDAPGGPYAILGLSPEQLEALTVRYGERCRGSSIPDEAVLFSIFEVPRGEFLAVERRAWTNTLDFGHAEQMVRIAGDGVMAQIAWRPAVTAALWTPRGGGEPFLGRFENCLRALTAYRLLELGGALLHSSGVVSGGEAWVFFGHSGAGKTTLARRCADSGLTVLSDDINAVFVDGSTPYVVRVPFAGELGQTNELLGPFPLAALSRLEQSTSEWWRPLSAGRAVASLLSCSPFLNADPYRLPKLLKNLSTLAASARVGSLGFTLEGDIWPTLVERAS